MAKTKKTVRTKTAAKRTTKASKKTAPKQAASKKSSSKTVAKKSSAKRSSATKTTAKKSTTKKKATKKKATKKVATKKAASSSAKRSTKKRATKAKAEKVTNEDVNVEELEVTVDRRGADESDRRSDDDRRQETVAVDDEQRELPERRAKVARRRQIDPTTCERDYTGDEIEFMHALDEYKRKAGRMFPTCSEILEVVRGLGYRRLTPEEVAILNPPEISVWDGDESVDGEAATTGENPAGESDVAAFNPTDAIADAPSVDPQLNASGLPSDTGFPQQAPQQSPEQSPQQASVAPATPAFGGAATASPFETTATEPQAISTEHANVVNNPPAPLPPSSYEPFSTTSRPPQSYDDFSPSS